MIAVVKVFATMNLGNAGAFMDLVVRILNSDLVVLFLFCFSFLRKIPYSIASIIFMKNVEANKMVLYSFDYPYNQNHEFVTCQLYFNELETMSVDC